MRAVITRVSSAFVDIDGNRVAQINKGLLALVGMQEGDTPEDIKYIVEKTINLRIFEDEQGKLNLSLLDVGGELCVVSQFTLLGDARKGRRPSFITAGSPEWAKGMYEQALAEFSASGVPIQSGEFQADMKVGSVNDGPVTILLDSRKVF